MDKQDFLTQLEQRASKVGGNIELAFTPLEEHEPKVVGEHWTIYFVSGSGVNGFAAWRDFELMMKEKYHTDNIEYTSVRVENLPAAHALVEDIKLKFGAATAARLQVEDIRERYLPASEPVYVVVVVWKIVTRQHKRRADEG